jgi:hypothetical protein
MTLNKAYVLIVTLTVQHAREIQQHAHLAKRVYFSILTILASQHASWTIRYHYKESARLVSYLVHNAKEH